VAAALPSTAPTPTLLGSYDDGEWVALVYEDIEGRHPVTPWLPDELRLAMGLPGSGLARPVTAAGQRPALRRPRHPALLDRYAAGAGVCRADLTAALAGLAGYFTDGARRPAHRACRRCARSSGPSPTRCCPGCATHRRRPRRAG